MNAVLSRVARAAVIAGTLGGCRMSQPHLADPVSARSTEWTSSLARASDEAAEGRYATADKLLADFTVRFAATPEAAESMYWRALYKLDPSNASGASRDAVVLLDGYLASGAAAHRAEAQTLKRVAYALDTRPAAPSIVGPKVDMVKIDDKARDDEVQRLKDELAKAHADLERIKRRLAQPRP
ncbi:MAG: hypothetical protein ABI969_17745 [bacterium]